MKHWSHPAHEVLGQPLQPQQRSYKGLLLWSIGLGMGLFVGVVLGRLL